jgi:exonuclease SbcD
MTEFTFITCSDIHISDLNPRARKDNFKESVFDKIDQIRVACNKLKADALLIAGDLFNFKAPTKNSHALTRELIEVFKKFKCPIYMIPGNHDLTGNNLESLDNQPLGVLFASDAVFNLTHKVIEKKGVKISLVGIPFTEDLDLDTLQIPPKEDCVAQVCLLHIYAGPKAGMLFKDRLYGYEEISKLSPDVFVIGHYHVDQGIQEAHGKQYVNLGAISRGTIAEENIQHQPKIGIIKVVKEENNVTITATPVPLNVKPAEEIFDLKKKEEEKQEATEMQRFVDHLVTSSVNTQSKRDMSAIVMSMPLIKAVQDKVLHYLQAAAK